MGRIKQPPKKMYYLKKPARGDWNGKDKLAENNRQ